MLLVAAVVVVVVLLCRPCCLVMRVPFIPRCGLDVRLYACLRESICICSSLKFLDRVATTTNALHPPSTAAQRLLRTRRDGVAGVPLEHCRV